MLLNWANSQFFRWVHGNHLVYNTCWEDPRLDRQALDFKPTDKVLVITSAGCNALDYALAGVEHVYAVDMNPRQNALLELKLAAAKTLEYPDYFQLFGRGRAENFGVLYNRALRPALSPGARIFWDQNGHFFKIDRQRPGFYYHGATGLFARGLNFYLDRRPALREGVNAILNAASLAEQQQVYFGGLKDLFWNGFLRWVANRNATMALIGVPQAQRLQVERHFGGSIARFAEECLDSVFAWLPFQDNYFWRVYLTGEYTPQCCPEYLREQNFHRLKNGVADHVSAHTATVQHFLERHEGQIDKFVLLDHMDWLSTQKLPLLKQEWQSIVDRAAPDARIIWRSGGMKVDFVDPLVVRTGREYTRVGERLTYHHDLARKLHRQDRVHTYGSFYIADLASA